jgi:hypothetical protein
MGCSIPVLAAIFAVAARDTISTAMAAMTISHTLDVLFYNNYLLKSDHKLIFLSSLVYFGGW